MFEEGEGGGLIKKKNKKKIKAVGYKLRFVLLNIYIFFGYYNNYNYYLGVRGGKKKKKTYHLLNKENGTLSEGSVIICGGVGKGGN